MKTFVLEITTLSKGDKHGNGYHDCGTPSVLELVAVGTQVLRQHILLDSSLLLDVVACVYTYKCIRFFPCLAW